MRIDLLIWYGVASIALGASLKSFWAGLQRVSSPPAVFVIAAGTSLAWTMTALAAALGWLPWFAPILVAVAPLSVLLFGGQLINLAGGPTDKESLRRAYYRIIGLAENGSTLTEREVEKLRHEIVGLDRYRSSETTEFITQAQADLLDWADRRTPEPQMAEARDRRIQELGRELWLRAPDEDSPRDIPTR